MAKKLNLLAATIKTLFKNKVRPIDIARKLKISKQRVNYWIKTPIKSSQIRRKKLDKIYIDKIISLGENQTTSSMSSRKIANIMNAQFQKEDINLSISKDTVNRYLKEAFGKPRKIHKVFHLTKKQKIQRVKFCQNILDKMINGKNIFFTDETQIKTGSFINDSIRLSQENQKKLKEGKIEAYNLINRPEKKFEASIMVAGVVSSLGLSNIILVENTVNEFAYAQMLLYFKEDFDKLQEKADEQLYFEQDGATPHTSESNKNLIKKLFGNNFIQNTPNSPDLAYPIENIWGYLKPRIKKRNPQTIEELKKYTVEEWNKIPLKIIKNCGKHYIRRLEKIIEIKGERMEQYYLNQIKEEEEAEQEEAEQDEAEQDKENEEDEKQFNDEDGEKDELKTKIVYNDKRLGIIKKKEIANLRKQLKKIRENYRKDNKESKKYKAKDFKLMSVSRAESIFKWKNNLKTNKDKKVEEITKKIESINKMDLIAYLKYSKEKYLEKKTKREKNKEDNDDDSTIDEIEEAINKIFKINKIEEEDEGIKYELNF